MEKTLLEEFERNPKILLNENLMIKQLNKINDNSIEATNELISDLNIPKLNQNTLKFIFYELIGNIYDHSKFSEAHIAGRQNKNKYDFIFMDNGISIINSFKNANYPVENDCDSLMKAINGLSTKNEIGYIERGTGLNNTTNIVVNGFDSEILIVSNNALLYMSSENIILKKIQQSQHNGTLVYLRLNLDSEIDIYKYLSPIKYKL